LSSGTYYCPKCTEAIEQEKRQKEKAEAQRFEELKRIAAVMVVTTTPSVDGHYIRKYLGIDSVEFVIGTGAFSEISSSLADFFGARSSAFENKLQSAKKQALGALKLIAAEQGANAVVGVDLDYTEFSGNRIGLVINGTLVEIAPLSEKLSQPNVKA
jgi:uncharacterized protein YbjQ (UPF0145 family)